GPTSTSATRSSNASADLFSAADAELAPHRLAAIVRLNAPRATQHLEQPQPAAGRHLGTEFLPAYVREALEVRDPDDRRARLHGRRRRPPYARRPSTCSTGVHVRGLGVDPGLTRCGLGVVDGGPGRAALVAVGVVTTPADAALGARLVALEEAFEAWLDAH